MKIALIGYGKMGHIIGKIAIERGHQIVCIIDKDNREEIFGDAFKSADCAIEFSTPGTALENIRDAFAGGVPVVCGTTGWLDSLPDIKAACADDSNTFLFASNFSIGVNIFMALNRYLGKIMNNFPQYTPALEEFIGKSYGCSGRMIKFVYMMNLLQRRGILRKIIHNFP